MKVSKKSLVVVGMTLLTIAGAALADQATPIQQQNLSKRPLSVEAGAEKADQAWVGTGLKVSEPAQSVAEHQRQLLNLRFASKRAYQ